MTLATLYRLRDGLAVTRSPGGFWQVEDEELRRAVRLGDADAALLQAIDGRSVTAADLRARLGHDDAELKRRLSALARLYVLDGSRSRQRLELQDARFDFADQCKTSAHKETLEWPLGRNPPQHGCVATGTCCTVTFLGPLTHADRVRVEGLVFRARRAVDDAEQLFEDVDLDGKHYLGMAHDAASGRCVAQREDLLCDIHAEHSLESKPVACRQFPLRFYRSPQGVHVSLLLACDGYHRSRDAAQPWASREPEIRQLLHEGASWVRMAVPLEWSAGVPVPVAQWWPLRAALFEREPEDASQVHAWLADVLHVCEERIAQDAAALAEGPEVAWPRTLGRWIPALARPWTLYDADDAEAHAGSIAVRAGDLRRRRMKADADRLTEIAAGLRAQCEGLRLERPSGASDEPGLPKPMPATPAAWRHLADIVANDLQVQVVLGQLDAGLMALVRRLLLAEALACWSARKRGSAVVETTDTTRALHAVYRSEPDLGKLGQILAALPA